MSNHTRFQLFSLIQYPKLPLCGDLIIYARATPLPRGTLEPPYGSLKFSQQVSSHIHVIVCLNIDVFSSFLVQYIVSHITLGYPYVVTLLLYPRVTPLPRLNLATPQGSLKFSQRVSSHIHIPYRMSKHRLFSSFIVYSKPQYPMLPLGGDLITYARATPLPRVYLGTPQGILKFPKWVSSIHAPYRMSEHRRFSSFLVYSKPQYPMLPLCGDLITYARATPLPRENLGTPKGSLKTSQLLSSHINPPYRMSEDVIAHFIDIVPQVTPMW